MGKIARLTNGGTLMLKGEVIEYPPELEGGRNLVSIKRLDELVGDRDVYTISGGSIIIKNSYATISSFGLGEILEPNQQYTLSYKHRLLEGEYNSPISGTMRFLLGDSTYTFGSNNNTTFSTTFVAGEDINRTSLYFYASSTGVIEFYDFKIEKGDNKTPWTPAPEDLGMEYPDDIQHFTTGFRSNGKVLVREIIEYPSELEGGRNYFIDKLMLDVTNYESIGPYHYYTIENLSPNKAYTVSVKGNFANEITIPTTGNRALRINNDKTNSLGVDIIDVRAAFGVRTYKRQVNSNEDGKLFIVNFVPDLLPEIYRMVKLEKGTQATPWTPAPEDLGLEYSNDIQYFNMGIKEGRLMVTELIENAIL